ncbi:phosphotransferase family protein [Polymorphospora rubra]|uniref:Aminoglycoside phosphotransferase n=1 Tax=Polymorphospora rubra TaxID=338584 RepID=A0A810N5X0_9ACTN|nr:phosphotransferase [Polymorphospora rubra]BCJ69141.1 aminoglycoside phosphotransferase [Polymorphospora rubra]
MTRQPLGVDDLTAVVRAVFGAGRRAAGVERLRGGSRKGVYRLTLDDGATVVVYVWNAGEDYWPPATDRPDPFGHPGGADRFEAAHTALSSVGVRVPRILLLDRGGKLVAGDLAVVEDVAGGTLERLRERDPRRAGPVLARLADTVRVMHAHHRDRYGRPGRPAPADAPPVPDLVLDRALGHLAGAAARVERIAALAPRLADELRDRHAAVGPRTGYGLIHGELGPDHVLVDDRDGPVLIDIEGVRYFDVEWEHAFLELRFGDGYRRLAAAGLDAARLRLYRLALYLSLVDGPLRLLDGDFPDRAGMRAIAAANIDRTVAELSARRRSA